MWPLPDVTRKDNGTRSGGNPRNGAGVTLPGRERAWNCGPAGLCANEKPRETCKTLKCLETGAAFCRLLFVESILTHCQPCTPQPRKRRNHRNALATTEVWFTHSLGSKAALLPLFWTCCRAKARKIIIYKSHRAINPQMPGRSWAHNRTVRGVKPVHRLVIGQFRALRRTFSVCCAFGTPSLLFYVFLRSPHGQ